MGREGGPAYVGHDGEIDGQLPALVPPGEYQLALSHWTTYLLFGKAAKLTLWFRVVQQGPHFGAILPRHYNVKSLSGRARRNGQFKATHGGDLVREYARLLPSPGRLDRIALQPLTARVVVGRVDTVTNARDQKELPSCVRYSVIRELLRVEA